MEKLHAVLAYLVSLKTVTQVYPTPFLFPFLFLNMIFVYCLLFLIYNVHEVSYLCCEICIVYGYKS